MTHRFTSIANSHKLVYVFDSGHHYEQYGLSSRLRWYETYGDGECQHSPTTPINLQLLDDCLFSLAQALLASKELYEACNYDLRSGIASDQLLAFAFSVKFKDGDKPRYYSLEERKVTSSDKARYDRRYERIETRHNGSIDAVFNMLCKDYYNGLQRFALMWSISQYSTNVLNHGWHGDVASLMKWEMPNAARTQNGFQAVLSALDGWDAMENARRRVGNYLRELEHAKEQAAEATEGAA